MKEQGFIAELKERLYGRVILLGVGNEQRSDDAVGSLIAKTLNNTNNFFSIDCGDIPENYTGPVREYQPDTILFIDAVDFGGQPGEVIFLEPEALEDNRFNTHRPSLRLVMEYLKIETGSEISFIGIQPGTIVPGSGLTPAVEDTKNFVITAITEFLDMMSDEDANS